VTPCDIFARFRDLARGVVRAYSRDRPLVFVDELDSTRRARENCFARAPVASSSLAARRSAFRSSTPDAMAFASTRAIALETPPRARLASRRGDVAGVRRVVMHRAEGRHRSAGGASSLRERRPSSRHRHRQRVVVAAAAAADDDDSNKGLGLLEWLGPVIPQGALVTGVKGGWKLAWCVPYTGSHTTPSPW
jgi:hypothetical protein